MKKLLYPLCFVLFLGGVFFSWKETGNRESVHIKGIMHKYLAYELYLPDTSSLINVTQARRGKRDTSYFGENPLRVNLENEYSVTKIRNGDLEVVIDAKAMLPPVQTFFSIGYHLFRSGDTITVAEIDFPFRMIGEFINYDINARFPAVNYNLILLKNGNTSVFRYSENVYEPKIDLEEIKDCDLLIVDGIMMNVFGETIKLKPHLIYLSK